MNDKNLLYFAKKIIDLEIKEAKKMRDRLDNSIVIACRLLMKCKGKIIVSGIGKSGHIGKKIAASLASTGTPAFFIHATEAMHGDLGVINTQDLVIFISYSGYTKEIYSLLPTLIENQITIIALTGDLSSPLAKAAKCILNISVEREACPIGLAPTSSTVNTLMMGDALAMTIMHERGFGAKQFARSHPGGNLGIKALNHIFM